MLRITWVFAAVCAGICASEPILKLPVLKQTPSEVNFKQGEEFVIECITDFNDESVKYSWLKDGKPFTASGDVVQRENEGTLAFKKPGDTDEGQYQCLAQTSFGVASTQRINFKKMFLESPKVALQKQKAVEGKVFKLDCAIPKAYPKPEIIWYRKSLSTNDEKEIVDQRLTISPEGTLYFSNVSSTDAGYKFICKAKTPAYVEPVVLAEHVFDELLTDNGQQNNDVIKQYVSNEVTAKVGDATYLYCIYGGNPLAHPDWFKDGVNVNNGPKDRVTRHNKSVGKRLLIKDTWLSDQGEYTCVVDNEVGRPGKHTMKLNVVSAPQFIEQTKSIIKVKRGDNVTLPCVATGVPPPLLSWSYNAKETKADLKYHSERNVTSTTFPMSDVTPEQSGYYGCTATNEHGEIYTETLLYVQ